ncbi:MAG: type II 3-dehydroquinate dehydratase [Gammaproteobacteria bacterium]|nr:type II 3-dehydroquinate dehydratase [Gammaproteobacteria bacterium]
MASILVINGPNLNLLGTREPEVYGTTTLDDIQQMLAADADKLGHELQHYQSNAEHEIIDRIHQAHDQGVSYIIINPGAFTHTSIALRDALLGVGIPYIEVHLSNVFARETFRQHSYLSDKAIGVISGLGAQGYLYALNAIGEKLKQGP